MSKRKQDDLEDLSANPEKKRKRSGEPSAKTSAERSQKYRASLSEEQKRKKKVEAAKKTKTAYNAMTPQQRIERSQRQAELYKTMRKEEKDAYIAANAQRMTTTYHAMPEEEKDAYIAANAQRMTTTYHAMSEEEKDAYIAANAQRMTTTYHAMDPEQKSQLNVDKARRSREMYHAMDADDKAATIAASSDNRKRRKLCDEKNVLLKEALRKRMARGSSLDEPRNAETDLDESIKQFWELRSSGQLDPSVHPAYRYALYALTLFKPWDLVTGVPAPSPSWETYCQYVVDLASASASLRQRSILQLLENLAEGLHGNVVNATRKMLVSKYRARAVKPWKDLPASEKPIDPTALYRDTEKVIPEQDMDQARIDAMRAVLTKTTAITTLTYHELANTRLE
eukprot:gene11386-8103_t